MLKLRRTNLIATLSNSRGILRAAGLPVDHLTAYRRVVRVCSGEAVDMVTEVHRLAVADRYLARLTDNQSQRTAAAVLRQWMDELEESDREGELAFAAVCGYADLVKRYRSESAS